MQHHSFMTHPDEQEESIIERRERERGEPGKIENEEVLPLFPDAKQDQRKLVIHLAVTKMDPPGDGWKGNLPPHADMETIAKLYGNGVYNIDAITAAGKAIRRMQGVKISWQPPAANQPESTRERSSIAHMDVLQWQAEEHTRQNNRIREMSDHTLKTTKELSDNHTKTLSSQYQATIEAERGFMKGVIDQQQTFFAAMFERSEQNHRQAMERADQSFRQTITVMVKADERAREASNPNMLLQVLQQGFMLGRGVSPEEEPDDDEEEGEDPQGWAKVLTEGIGAVKDIAEVAKLKAVSGQPAPAPKSLPPANTPKSDERPRKRRNMKSPFSREELQAIYQAKHLAQQKGIDFADAVRKASLVLIGGMGVDATESQNESRGESDDSEESDSESNRAPESDDA